MSEQEPTYEELRSEAWNTMSQLIAANKDNRETVSQEAILRLGMFFADTSPTPSRHQIQTGTSPFAAYQQLLLRAYNLLEDISHPYRPVERHGVNKWLEDAEPLVSQIISQEQGQKGC